MTGTAAGALIAAGASLIVALLSGAVTLRNSSKTNENSLEIQDFKGAVDNAPFYPAPIREAANDTHANDTHGAAKDLIDMHLTALTHFAKGVDVTQGEQFIAESETVLRSIVEGVDLVESLIRDRLAAVEVCEQHSRIGINATGHCERNSDRHDCRWLHSNLQRLHASWTT
jgi:hypothetical protein